MARLGLPYLHITFIDKAAAFIKRGDRGVVALILQDPTVSGVFQLTSISDIPKDLSERNKEQIRLAFIGYQRSPRKVVVSVEQSESANNPKFDITTKAFKVLETIRFDYLAVPFADKPDSLKIATWIKNLNDNEKKMCKVVLANTSSDSEKVINFTTEKIKTEEKEYTTTEYTARIAGLLAGTPMQISATYAPLPEVKDCSYSTRSELAERIGRGELVLMNDGEKVKIARAVNSLITTSEIKGESFRKIKIVDIMDAMSDDISTVVEDQYLGKYPNDYDHKLMLCSAILGYCETLENESLLDKGKSVVEIDVPAQKAYLRSINYKTADGRTVEDMEIKEIKEANTKDKVFIRAYTKILDAIEEIELKVEI